MYIALVKALLIVCNTCLHNNLLILIYAQLFLPANTKGNLLMHSASFENSKQFIKKTLAAYSKIHDECFNRNKWLCGVILREHLTVVKSPQTTLAPRQSSG